MEKPQFRDWCCIQANILFMHGLLTFVHGLQLLTLRFDLLIIATLVIKLFG